MPTISVLDYWLWSTPLTSSMTLPRAAVALSMRRHGLIDRGLELVRLVLLERLADCGQRPGPIASRHAGGVDGMLEPGPACQASGQEKGSLDSRQRIIDPPEYSGRNRVAARQSIESHVQLRRP